MTKIDRQSKSNTSQERVSVVVTSYNPDSSFIDRFSPLLSYCESIIVCDNTPGGTTFSDAPDGFEFIIHKENLGLGPALNSGIQKAKENNTDVVVLFDQDSTPTVSLIQALHRSLALVDQEHTNKTCIGPFLVDDKSAGLDIVAAEHQLEPDLDYGENLPTSGMTFRLSNIDQHTLFTDDLFIDWVDHEWCYRLAKQGWRFARNMNAKMPHRLGEREAYFFSKRFFVPTPFRHYFQVRDGLALLTLKHVPLHAKIRIILTYPARMVLYPIILEKGLERLKWMLMGTAAAFRREVGAGKCADIVLKISPNPK